MIIKRNIKNISYKDYYINNKENILDYQKEYYTNNKENILEYRKEYYMDNKVKYQNYYTHNKDKILDYQKDYFLNTKENIHIYKNEKIQCITCNCIISKGNYLKHTKSKKHQQLSNHNQPLETINIT